MGSIDFIPFDNLTHITSCVYALIIANPQDITTKKSKR
jgi:hypothetical protein